MNQHSSELKRRIQELLMQRARRTIADPALTCASVLVPLLYREGEWHVLVTQRTQTVEHHKGQISFPGGACEPGDRDLLSTALRETWEEIGIPPGVVEVLGALDDMQTITNFVVTPFVGVISHPVNYRLHTREVEAVVEVPLQFVLNPDNLRVEQRQHEGRLYDVLFWDYGPYTIWGATARILQSLLELIG